MPQISKRQSNAESIRLIAMTIIVACHMVIYNAYPIMDMNPTLNKALTLFFSQGSIGDDLFFLITAWFLAKKTACSSAHKIWSVEKETLFYSLTLLLAYAFYKTSTSQEIELSQVIKSLFPIMTGMYWYVTSYVVFLIIWPCLHRGLQILDDKAHFNLLVTLTVIWSILPTIPQIQFDIGTGQTFLTFVLIYIQITFIRWRAPRIEKSSIWKQILAISAILDLLVIIAMTMAAQYIDLLSRHSFAARFLTKWPNQICSLAICYGLFFIIMNKSFSNKVIDFFASGTFGVYLIHGNPFVASFLWNKICNGRYFYNLPASFLIILLLAAIIVLLFASIDRLRHVLFKYLLENPMDNCFNICISFIEKALVRWRHYLTTTDNQ